MVVNPSSTSKLAPEQRWLGRPVERVEDATLLTGSGYFTDDLPVRAGTLHAAILRSPHAHAEILSIDTSKAAARPGVVAVLTGSDIKADTDPFIIVLRQPMDQWSLATDRVRFVGEAVAVVVAENRYLAEDAVDDIKVEYRKLPAVIDPLRALEKDSPLVHPEVGSNVPSTAISHMAIQIGVFPRRTKLSRSRSIIRATHRPRLKAMSSSPTISPVRGSTTFSAIFRGHSRSIR